MIEQELASIITFVLDSTGNPAPYYWTIKEDFAVPAAFFPEPEIVSGPDTFLTYGLDYAWYIKFFAPNDAAAYQLGLAALKAVRGKRNLIPLINTDGEAISGSYVRVDDPSIKMLDDGACQMAITWTSRRPYDDEEYEQMVTYELVGWKNPDIYETVTVTTALESAIANYNLDYPNPDYSGEYPE